MPTESSRPTQANIATRGIRTCGLRKALTIPTELSRTLFFEKAHRTAAPIQIRAANSRLLSID